METDTVHKVMIKVLMDEGVECELDAQGHYRITGTILKPGASEEEKHEVSRKSFIATGVLLAFRDITQKENGPTPLEQALAIERSFTKARLIEARLAEAEKEKGGVQLCRSKLNQKYGRRF